MTNKSNPIFPKKNLIEDQNIKGQILNELMEISFTEEGWEDYTYWQTEDEKALKRINDLIKDISKNPFEGIGAPEALKNELSGKWGRRIDKKNRLVYEVSKNSIIISKCRGHY